MAVGASDAPCSPDATAVARCSPAAPRIRPRTMMVMYHDGRLILPYIGRCLGPLGNESTGFSELHAGCNGKKEKHRGNLLGALGQPTMQ